MNFDRLIILGTDAFLKRVKGQLENGDNIVFFINHQSYVNSQVVPVLLDVIGEEKLARNMFFVAGHKVSTDTLTTPFSMGGNLIFQEAH